MNNHLINGVTGKMCKELVSILNSPSGKYVCIVLCVCIIADRVYDLSIKAMDKGCAIHFQADENSIEFDLGQQAIV